MSHPLILIADHRPRELAVLVDAVARRYGADYRVVGRPTAAAALDEVERTRDDGDEVALVVADQSMPEVSGRAPAARTRRRS